MWPDVDNAWIWYFSESIRKRFERILKNEDLKIQFLNFIDLMKAYFASFQDQYLLAKNYI